MSELRERVIDAMDGAAFGNLPVTREELTVLADAVLAALDDGPRRVWSVNEIHDPTVGHGYEPIALFSTEAAAEAFCRRCETAHKDAYGFDVDVWTVDDPATMGEAPRAAQEATE